MLQQVYLTTLSVVSYFLLLPSLTWFVFPANKIRLWNKGVDSESFHPRFRNKEMRSRLTYVFLFTQFVSVHLNV
jgi:hypothetical protein